MAAGNDGRDNSANTDGYGTITAPGNDPFVITVGAMNTENTLSTSDDRIASYSSKGPTLLDHIVKPDLVAPGNLIVSVLGDGTLPVLYPQNVTDQNYFILSGTSMATPMVSGAAALQYADNGTNDHLWEVLSVGGGQYKIQNVNSTLLLDISGASKSAGVDAVQSSDTGASSQLWTLTAAGAAYVNPGLVTGNIAPVHDPSMIKTGTSYALFATGGGIEQRASIDRTNFTPTLTAHAFAALPAWTAPYTNGTDLWAPDVSFNGGQYYLYFAASTFGSSNSAIGLAISPTGDVGSWVDSGAAVLTSATCAGSNAIDPAFISDAAGNWWLAFGSFFNGINMVQLDPSTGKPLGATPTCYSLAQRTGTAIEGSTVYLHAGMYYLFASVDTCCQGINSTYHIVVGRSNNPQGPYLDRGGISMTQGGGTIVLATHGNIIGPGGQDIFSDTDGDVLVYHYYDGNNGGTPTLGINLLGWTSDGWPFVH